MRNLVSFAKGKYQSRMLRRPQCRFGRTIAVVMACIAILIYASASPVTHAPDLHASASALVSQAHGHDHGDHSHDDWDAAELDTVENDHHHADHTHDTASLVGASDASVCPERRLDHPILSFPLSGGPPFGIDRPPRSMT